MTHFDKFKDGFDTAKTSSFPNAWDHFQNSETKEDYDQICANLALLDDPQPGMRVVLETGEEFEYWAGRWKKGDASALLVSETWVLPLLRAAIAGGKARVSVGDEE